MRIILEGPDNAGKTTLGNELQRRILGVLYVHAGGAPEDLDDEIRCMDFQERMLRTNHRLIQDRVTSVSQQVYNSDESLDRDRMARLRQLLAIENTVLIYCRPATEVLVDTANFTWRAEETEAHRQKIITRAIEFIDRYDAVMQKVPCICYDYRDTVHAELIRVKLVQALAGERSAIDWFSGLLRLRG